MDQHTSGGVFTFTIMKKIFFLAAAMLAAVTVSAQDYRNIKSESDYEITGAVKSASSTDTKVIYDMKEAGVDVMLAYGNTEASITNTDLKTSILTVALGKYIEFGGKNGVLHVYETAPGAEVTVRCACKSEKGDGILTVLEGAQEVEITLPKKDKSSSAADKDGYTWVDAKFTATASEVVLKETEFGYRVESISVSGAQGIQDAMWAPKAKKVMENGQMLIVRDGVKYNALGTVVE